MGKIKATAPTELHKALFGVAEKLKEKNCCGVIAIAALTGRSFEEVQKVMEENGRKPREASSYDIIEETLSHFGLTPRKLNYEDRRAIIDQYPGVHKGLKSITPNHAVRFKAVWEKAGIKNGLIFTKGHVSALKDGVVHDFNGNEIKRVVSLWLFDREEAPEAEEAPEVEEVSEEAVTIEPEIGDGLEGKSVADLRKLCKEVGVKGYGTMSKSEVIAAIRSKTSE